jgi:hypothetical protein
VECFQQANLYPLCLRSLGIHPDQLYQYRFEFESDPLLGGREEVAFSQFPTVLPGTGGSLFGVLFRQIMLMIPFNDPVRIDPLLVPALGGSGVRGVHRTMRRHGSRSNTDPGPGPVMTATRCVLSGYMISPRHLDRVRLPHSVPRSTCPGCGPSVRSTRPPEPGQPLAEVPERPRDSLVNRPGPVQDLPPRVGNLGPRDLPQPAFAGLRIRPTGRSAVRLDRPCRQRCQTKPNQLPGRSHTSVSPSAASGKGFVARANARYEPKVREGAPGHVLTRGCGTPTCKRGCA